MNQRVLLAAGLIASIALGLCFQPVLAHETVSVGDFQIEYGWLNEPAIAGQQNAIVVNVSNIGGGEAQPVEDVSSFTVTVAYGGQSKPLSLQPSGEDMPGQFVAPILPTIPGEYSLIFGGSLGDTAVDQVEVQPEEVQTADVLQFPNVETTDQSAGLDNTNWLIYLSLLIGVVALALGGLALRRPR